MLRRRLLSVHATALACLLLMVCSTSALIHNLHVSQDSRFYYLIESFGFLEGGVHEMEVTNFEFNAPASDSLRSKVGFIIKKTETDAPTFLEEHVGEGCLLDETTALLDPASDAAVPISGKDFTNKFIVKSGQDGFYSTFFINCANAPVTYNLKLTQKNPGPYEGDWVFLPAGEAPLPTLYFAFTAVYVAALALWVFYIFRGQNKRVFAIHYLMAVLVILKILSILFEGIEYHFKKIHGIAGGWAIAYYVFATLKGITMFVVIALIGTGWKFIKPYLSEKDKKIFLVVISLQVIDNIALVVIEETAPGSQGLFTWKDIFRLVDIVCCGAILVPIIWSIKHLREASQIDGKAARNLEKLQLFRQFYLLVVSYIYFTRIIVYLLEATLPYRLSWLAVFFTELATVFFYGVTGYKFRPLPDNPYFKLDDDEAKAAAAAMEMEEMGNRSGDEGRPSGGSA